MPSVRAFELVHTCPTIAFVFLSFLLVEAGCLGESEAPEPRHRFSLDELTVRVRDTPRSFFLSDRKGGFVIGHAGAQTLWNLSWSVDGREILRSIEIRAGEKRLDKTAMRGAIVRPDDVALDFGEVGRLICSPIEALPEHIWGLALSVESDSDAQVSFRLTPAREFCEVQRSDETCWQEEKKGKILSVSGGSYAKWQEGELLVGGSRDHRVAILLSGAPVSIEQRAAIHSALPGMMAHRTERMEGILERSYLRLSDSVMTKALAWCRLSADAMLVERAETLAVSSLPWDGSYDGRANLQSLVGVALAPGDYATAASLLRNWGASQDVTKRHTFGRIASRLHGSPPEYKGVDVGAWFARGVYDYVVASDDTTSLKVLFPVVRRSINGMSRNNTTRTNLVVHRNDETWMGEGRFAGSRGPYSAVEVQTLWRYQQTIGGILAQLRGDTALARVWMRGALATAEEFAKAFIDTGRSVVFDYLDGEGRGVDVLRPNGMLALDGIESERAQQALLRRSVAGLLYPQGPGTLVKTGHGFLRSPAGEVSRSTDGAVIPWLLGAFTYGLTRADRQDLAYGITRSLAERSLDRGMVGTIPEAMTAGNDGEESRDNAEQGASLLGAAEFVRSVYQDYLGIRVDAPSSVIRCEPKLPPEIRSAGFSVYMGSHLVTGSYQKIGATGRMDLKVSDVPRPVKWRFIWMLENGDAWVGAVRLQPGSSAAVVFTNNGMLVYQDGQEGKPEEAWCIRGFSRSKEVGDMTLATPDLSAGEGKSSP
jgi:glycogen debranching enzyme